MKVAKRHPEFMRRVTMINDMSQRYFSTEICDVVKHVKLPEREHPFDQYSVKELDRYQSRWEIIE